MNNLNTSNNNIVQSTTFSFSDIVKAIPLWMQENIAWFELYTAIGKTLDTLLDSNLVTLAELRDPTTLNSTLLPLAASMLGFRWEGLDTIDLAILRTIVETITSYYSVNGAGAIVIEKAMFQQINDPYLEPSHHPQPPLPPDFDTNDFIETQTTAKIVSFILDTVISIEALWTKDYIHFYTISEAGALPLTWLPSTLSTTSNWDSIAFGANTFIVIASGTVNSSISTDGTHWVNGGNLPAALNWSSIVFGNGVFLAIATGTDQTAYTFNYGASWVVNGSLPVVANWIDIVYGDGTTFLTIAGNNNISAISNDSGATWNAAGNLPANTTWISLAFGVVQSGALEINSYVAIANNSNIATYSINEGAFWNSSTLPLTDNWISLAYGNNVFIAIAANSLNTAYSLDYGQTWHLGGPLPAIANWSNVSFGAVDGNSVWVAIASGGTQSAYSIDNGITWIAGQPMPSTAAWNASVFGEELFVAVAGSSNNGAYGTIEALISYTSTIYPKYNPTITNPQYGDWYLSPHVDLTVISPNVDITYTQLISLFYYLAPITMVIESIYEPFSGEVDLYMNADPSTYTTTFISTATQA